jgi:hypothetical protein
MSEFVRAFETLLPAQFWLFGMYALYLLVTDSRLYRAVFMQRELPERIALPALLLFAGVFRLSMDRQVPGYAVIAVPVVLLVAVVFAVKLVQLIVPPTLFFFFGWVFLLMVSILKVAPEEVRDRVFRILRGLLERGETS